MPFGRRWGERLIGETKPMTAADLEQQCERYAHLKLWLSAIEYVLLLGTLVTLTLTGQAERWFASLTALEDTPWRTFFLYLVAIAATVRVALLPVQFVSGHLVEQRFGLSRQGALQWLTEWLISGMLVGLPLLLLVTPLAMQLRWWYLLLLPALAAGLALRYIYFEWLFLPLLSLFYPVRYLRTECLYLPGLGRRMLPVMEVQVSHKTRRANAGILLGRQPRVLVTDTLIDAFTDAEERVAIAHEFGHLYDRLFLEARTAFGLAQAKRKLLWNGAAWLVAALLTFTVESWIGPQFGLPRAGEAAAVPLLTAMLLFFAPLVLPFANAEARTDEKEADQYALRITHDAASYLSLMEKLRWINLEERRPGLISRVFFDTHPSYLERMRLGRAFRRRPTTTSGRHLPPHPNRRRPPQRHHVHGPQPPRSGVKDRTPRSAAKR
jgi:STE24 endopeptidase